ncbi:MAG TPA: GGDEF domain-containing protein [Rhizobacter sp.]|nr:GGDEF domain-containing protein [Rhizobacter sp.]
MELFTHLDTQALLAFNLILGIAMSVIVVVTRLGLGTAASRVDVWLVGSLFLPVARLVGPIERALPIGLQIEASSLVFPLILAGLYWQAEGMRALQQGPIHIKRVALVSIVLAVLAGLVHARFGERVLPVLFAVANLLLVRNALLLGRHFWGGRLLAGTALVLFIFNAMAIAGSAHSPEQIARRGLILQIIWSLFSTAGFLQCLYQDIRDRLDAAVVTDALTGALNRTGLMPMLRRDIEQAKRGGDLALVLCDLDHFKAINDTHGHPTGDKVLERFVADARRCLRSTDLLARWGGEEFLLVLPKSTIDEAVVVTRRVQQAIAASEATPKCTFSAGVACVSEARVRYDLEALMAVADQRLYVAKRTRNTIIWDDEAGPGIAEASG